MKKVKFGTGGFRGIIGDDFTKENLQLICQSLANISSVDNLKKEICIGYDNRFLSKESAEWCAQVFVGNGFKVELCDCATSTPIVMYETKKKNNDIGVMITASHNPYMFNGIKIFIKDGRDADIEFTSRIEEEYNSLLANGNCINAFNGSLVDCDNVSMVNYVDEFVEYLITNQQIPNCDNIKVVFDTKYGSTVDELKIFCEKINLKNYEIINAEHDAFFGFAMPAPNVDSVDKLSMSVQNCNANIGFALDADGDRLGVVDKNGKFYDNNYILSLVYYYLNKYENQCGDVVKNVATTSLLEKLADKFGYFCREVPVGFKWVTSALKKHNALVGGESSGGLALINHIWGKDSLLAIALVLKMMVKLNKSFDELINEVFDFVGGYNNVILDKQYFYSEDQSNYLYDIIFNKKLRPVDRFKIDKIVYKDYLKIYYKNGCWVLVRFSGTEPLFRIFVEADCKETANLIFEDWENLLGIK